MKSHFLKAQSSIVTVVLLAIFALPIVAKADYPPYCEGYGPGMMGGYGMGQGMMGGVGGGMMGGMGMMGPGMMGAGGFGIPDLTAQQREQLAKIRSEQRKRHLDIMGKMMEEQDRLAELYAAENPDTKKISAAHTAIGKLHQQMVDERLGAWTKMQAVLTKEQKEQLNQWRRGGGPGAGGYGPGMGPGSGRMMGR